MEKCIKILNIICLLFWVFESIYSILKFINNETISPAISICAILICTISYATDMVESFKQK